MIDATVRRARARRHQRQAADVAGRRRVLERAADGRAHRRSWHPGTDPTLTRAHAKMSDRASQARPLLVYAPRARQRARPVLYLQRKQTVEPVFAHTKHNRKFIRFHRRGRQAVRTESRLNDSDAQPHQAPQAPDSHRRGLKLPLPSHTAPHSEHTTTYAPTTVPLPLIVKSFSRDMRRHRSGVRRRSRRSCIRPGRVVAERGGGCVVVMIAIVREPGPLLTCRRTRRAEINRLPSRASDARASRGCPSLDAAPEVRDGPAVARVGGRLANQGSSHGGFLGSRPTGPRLGRFGGTKRPVACIVEHALERFWPDAVASIGTFWRWRTIARSGSQSLLGSRAVRRVGDR